jgi:hypothetical protein
MPRGEVSLGDGDVREGGGRRRMRRRGGRRGGEVERSGDGTIEGVRDGGE